MRATPTIPGTAPTVLVIPWEKVENKNGQIFKKLYEATCNFTNKKSLIYGLNLSQKKGLWFNLGLSGNLEWVVGNLGDKEFFFWGDWEIGIHFKLGIWENRILFKLRIEAVHLEVNYRQECDTYGLNMN